MKRLAVLALGTGLLLPGSEVRAQSAEQIDYLVAGVGAKLACSSVFVSRRPLEAAAGDVSSLLPGMTEGLEYFMAPGSATVSARRGMVTRHAYHRPGLGCTLSVDGEAPASQADPTVASNPAPASWTTAAAPAPAGADAPRLQTALGAIFTDAPGVETRAFLIVHRGDLVVERYADGFDADIPLLGWSMSKSVVATLIGLLTDDGRLTLQDRVSMPGWNEDDPRRTITIENLLHMSVGMAFTEDYSGADDTSIMLFSQSDMAAYAASRPSMAEPGRAWSYSSGATLMLSRVLTETLGGSEAVQAYARQRLFDPLGMTGAVMEQDGVGTPVGSSYVYATARDWARFGLLYLNGGVVDGVRILSEEWTEYVRRPAPASRRESYGAHFWLNGWDDDARAERVYPDLPQDSFEAVGHNGQWVVMIPSLDIVIVRLGWTTGQGRFPMNARAASILAALGVQY